MIHMFKRKEAIKEVSKDELDISFLQKNTPIGFEFTYLGRQCIVMSHFHCGYDCYYPALKYEYVDNDGIIHSGMFYMYQAKALFGNK